MTTTNPTTLIKSMTTGLSAWLDSNDPNGIFAKSDLGFLCGYYDANNDGLQSGQLEGTMFFREFQGRDGQVYVLSVAPSPSSAGQFDLALSIKGSDGRLTRLSNSQMAGLALTTTGIALSSDALPILVEKIQLWCDSRVTSNVSSAKIDFDSGANGTGDRDSTGNHGYCGWTQSGDVPDNHDPNPPPQGDPANNKSTGAVGGWGGYTVYKDHSGRDAGNAAAGGWGMGHHVTAYESYERNLAGATSEENATANTYADGRQPNGSKYTNWAQNNGVTIGRVKAVVNGKQIDTMGFQTTQQNLTYTFYWDPDAQCNRIAKVTDASGADVTNQVLSLYGSDNDFRKTWSDLKGKIDAAGGWVNQIVNPGGLTTYDVDKFSVSSKTGSAEESTEAEKQALQAFLAAWSAYLTGGRLTSLPTDKKEKKQMFEELLKLNSGDLMRLFTGVPGTQGASASGLNLLTSLIESVDLTGEQAQTLSEMMGKIMYLTGRELARNGPQSSQDQKNKVKLYSEMGSVCSSIIKKLCERTATGLFDRETRRRVLQSFMLGLQNFSGGKGKASDLTPEATMTYLVSKLVEAGGIDKATFTRNAASVLSDFGGFVAGMLGWLNGLASVASFSVLPPGDASSFLPGLKEVVSQVASQDCTQRLLAQYFGMMSEYASLSPEAKKQFEDSRQGKHEDSRKHQDTLLMILRSMLDFMRDAVNRAFQKN